MGNFALLRIPKESYDIFIVAWLVLIHALCLFAPIAFSWSAFAAFLALYLFTVGCISVGYHRLFTHRSFKTSKFFERLLAVGGTMAMQGSVMEWVAHHRMHHAHSDTAEDPHNARRGFWYCHMTWVPLRTPDFDDVNKLKKFARDVYADPFMVALGRLDVMLGIQLTVAVSLYLLGGWDFVVWGYFVRMVFTHHMIWFVNSAAHMWGYRNVDTPDLTRNNWWVALLAFGEGWHNNHHSHPDNPNFKRRWWEFDPGAVVVSLIRTDKPAA
jgi:stearoyl-CoA desaturase (delta-9 desaturase)